MNRDKINSILKTNNINELKDKLEELAKYNGIVLTGDIKFYDEIISVSYIIDTVQNKFYPEFIASTDDNNFDKNL